MEERFKSFLFKRIDQTIGDIREAGEQEEIERACETLKTYMDELKSLTAGNHHE